MSRPVETRAPVVLAVTTAMIVASSLFVFLRMISRVVIVRRVSWDDYFMLAAWLIAFGLSFSICFGTARGLGLHDVDIKPEWQSGLARTQYTFSVLYNPALMATKTSILIFYLNLSKTQPYFRRASKVILVVVNAAGLALTFLNFFQCRPVEDVFRDPLPVSAQCIDIVTLYLSSAPVNILTDLAILFLPMPILTAIHLPRKQKRILIFTFGLGGFVTIVDVVRIAYLQQASISRLQDEGRANIRLAGRDDFAWYASLSYMWTAVEVNVGIICACIPTLKPLIGRTLPRLLNDTVDMSQRSHGNPRSAPELELGSARAIRLPSPMEAAHLRDSPEPGVDKGMDKAITEVRMTADRTVSVSVSAPSPAARRRPSARYDFVFARGAKSMVNISARDSCFPLAMVTVLFFMWGFAYGLLSTLNAQFEKVVDMGEGQATGLHSAFWIGYFLGPLLVGRLVLKKWGFKVTFITGLCIYACGTLIFWPSAVLASYPAFLLSNLVVGLGLATLEVAANPFIILCGPMEYAETRLNLAQGVQAIGGVISPILATRVIFRNIGAGAGASLINAQWTYLSIALFDVALAVAFYYLPLPEATDEDLEEIALSRHEPGSPRVLGVSVAFVTLGLGVFSQFCYVGGQEAVSTAFLPLIELLGSGTHKLTPLNYKSVGHACFAIGRFLVAFLSVFVKPRRLLAACYSGSILAAVLAMTLSGRSGITAVLMITFFEAAIWPLIFAITVRSLGRHTKSGAAFLVSAASGGAAFPALMNALATGGRRQYSMAAVVGVYSFGALYPLYLNLVPAAKRQVDPARDDLASTPLGRRTTRALRDLARKPRRYEETGSVEHVEQVIHVENEVQVESGVDTGSEDRVVDKW